MIYILIVNFRGYDDTVACINSLAKLKDVTAKVVVIDNAADAQKVEKAIDNCVSAINASQVNASTQPAIRISSNGIHFAGAHWLTWISMGTNLGFAGANNIGIQEALKDPRCNFIWLLNNDTEVCESAAIEMQTKFFASPSTVICGSVLLYDDDRTLVQSAGGRYNRWLARGKNIGNGLRYTDDIGENIVIQNPQYVVGASMMLRVTFVERVGLLDTRYFLYFEELDYSLRVAPQEKIEVVPRSKVYHKEGRSIGTSTRGKPGETSTYYLTVNALRFTKKHYLALVPVVFAKILAATLIRVLRGDLKTAQVMFLAMKDYIAGRHRVGPYTDREFFRDK